ncbi:MAG TPA: pilus assembly protein PilM [Solirubrobacteraceae bacterium]|nr:pilus assembly protein PilM [Solirubrobacteraceae bacterium]HSD80394.1 pilus assembly protein PilM [Solirubrobacteraceae bacterium]
MAKRTKNVVGLDIDPAGVAVAQVAVNGHLEIQQAAFAELESGVVRDGEVADVDALTDTLKAIWREHRGLPRHVRVGVANQKIVVRLVELPPLEDRKELEAALRFQAQEQIPMPLENAVLDFHALGIADTGNGPRQRAVVVAARRDMIERLLLAVRNAGLRPEGIDLAAFAMIRALHRPGAAADGAEPEQTLYLWVGGITNLAVASGTTCVFTRASGGGLETLAVELAERRGLTLVHARQWLEHVGLGVPLAEVDGDEDIVEEARDVLNDGVRRIANEVRGSLDFQSSYGGSGAVSRVVLTGPAIAVPGFAHALEGALALPVAEALVDHVPPGVDPRRMTVAVGLAVTEALA